MASLQRALGQPAATRRANGSRCVAALNPRPFCSAPGRAPDACSSRRQLLSYAGSLWLLGGNTRHSQARQSTAVYQEISVQLPVTEESQEPIENPPTHVKATGKIIASECPAPSDAAWHSAPACSAAPLPQPLHVQHVALQLVVGEVAARPFTCGVMLGPWHARSMRPRSW
jgi:hypothetical protein